MDIMGEIKPNKFSSECEPICVKTKSSSKQLLRPEIPKDKGERNILSGQRDADKLAGDVPFNTSSNSPDSKGFRQSSEGRNKRCDNSTRLAGPTVVGKFKETEYKECSLGSIGESINTRLGDDKKGIKITPKRDENAYYKGKRTTEEL
jgi:hypothetical protein